MNKPIKALLWLWQLPQNAIGLALILLLKAEKREWPHNGAKIAYWQFGRRGRLSRALSGCAFGGIILLPPRGDYAETVPHEHGHAIQSRMLGPLYLPVVGLPSLANNIRARNDRRVAKTYYKRYPEAWADRLGGVEREGGIN